MTQRAVAGNVALETMFAQARAQGRSAFMPYFPVGWPTVETSLQAVEEMAAAGADGFEIGMPFSDPLADGPVIQVATQKALENGVTVRTCIDAVRTLRERGLDQPMLLMGYLNPLLAYGPEQFVADAKSAGADGVIIPDLPPEEGVEWLRLCRAAGLALVFFLAPTSSDARIEQVAAQASGFIYVVSLTGVTGARSSLPADLAAFLAHLKAQAGNLPLVLGFGIGTAEQAVQVNGLTDGFIVGSALVRAGGAGAEAAAALAGEIAQAIRAPASV
jgi:tryptophan synthase alpha chain